MFESLTRIAIAVVEHEGHFLIGQRPANVPLAGLWEFPGGKIEAGESPQDAAARECLEETGLDVTVGEEYPPVVHQYDHGRVELHFFQCWPCEVGQKPTSPYRWVALSELARYEFPEANAGLIRCLLQVGGAASGLESPASVASEANDSPL